MKMKHIRWLPLTAVLALLLASCSDDYAELAAKPSAPFVSVSPQYSYMPYSSSPAEVTFTATVGPGAGNDLSWSISNAGVAYITASSGTSATVKPRRYGSTSLVFGSASNSDVGDTVAISVAGNPNPIPTWTQSTYEPVSGNKALPGTVKGIAWGGTGGSHFVAVSDRGGIVYSDDGKDWKISTFAPPKAGWTGVAYSTASGAFVAVGPGGEFYTSTSGAAWDNSAYSAVSGTATALVAVTALAYGDGTFVAVRDDGGIATSTNGTNWTMPVPPPPNPEAQMYSFTSVCFSESDSTFYAVGMTKDCAPCIIESADSGTNWSDNI
jgi:hypothetical protein